MTGVPGTVGRSNWTLPRAPGERRIHKPSRLAGFTVPPLALRALSFFLLAFFAAAHWTALVEPVQTRRALVVAFVTTIGGVLIALTARLPRLPGVAVRMLLIVLTALIAVTAIGIRFKLLMPAGWSTLGDRVSGGLSVVGSVTEWPYAGPNVWLRQTTLLAAPLMVVLAAVLAFWPRADRDRIAALALLVGLYGVAAAARDFDHQTLRGAALLLCLALWLWLPRLRGRDAAIATTAIAVIGLIALTLTPRLASRDPWVDYRHWSWSLHKVRTITYNWQPSYGPLHWPRKGTTLLLIRSKHPQYWKAETLDHFDGRGWTQQSAGDFDPTIGVAGIASNPKWVATVHVTVRDLRSDVVVGPGSLLDVKGLSAQTVPLSNETALVAGQLEPGDTYTATGYTPDPTVKQMRAAPPPDPLFARYTQLDLGQPGGSVATEVKVPLRGVAPATGDPGAAQEIQRSRDRRIYQLARGIVGNARTEYDMVSRVGAWLEGHFAYSEKVPRHAYPLEAFLFQDRRGYCQQFSGTAALMLRMLGIPTRVATGFAPGTRNADTHEYVVRDLDAHSWIEVWFQGIGWVPFDPTPALAPASSQAASFSPFSENASAARGDTRDRLRPKFEGSNPTAPKGGGFVIKQKQSTPWGWIVLGVVFALLALTALAITIARLRARRRPLPPPCGDPDVDQLIRMLGRLGLDVPPETTLLELEKRLHRLAGDDAARYAALVRRRRFGAGGEPRPGRADRRRLRQVLAKAVGAGPLARVHLVMPDNFRH